MNRSQIKAALAKDGLVGVVRALGFEVEVAGMPPTENQLWERLDEPRLMALVLLALVGNRAVLLLALLELTAEVAQSAHERLAGLVPLMRLAAVGVGSESDFPSVQLEELGALVATVPSEVLPFQVDANHGVEKLDPDGESGIRVLTNPRTVPAEHRWRWMASECVVSAFAATCYGYGRMFDAAFSCAVVEAWASVSERLALFNRLSEEVAQREGARVVCRKLRECIPLEALAALDTGLFGSQQVISA